MLGKVRANSIRVSQVFLGRVSSLHGLMTTGASALFLLGSGVRTEGLLTKGDPSHPVDFSSSLSRGFFVDERHDIRFIQLGWSVTGPRSAGFGLDLVQQPHPFFTGRFLFSSQNALVGLESNYFVEAYAIAHLTFGGWGLLVQALAVEFVPDLEHCFFRDLMRGHPNTSMIRLIVRMNQRL